MKGRRNALASKKARHDCILLHFLDGSREVCFCGFGVGCATGEDR